MSNIILKGTIGVVFTYTVKRNGTALDISGASTYNLLFQPPSGTTKTFAGTFVTDGTDGQLKYTTAAASDLDEAGHWKISASIIMTGWTGQTSADAFFVTDTL